MQHNMKPQPLAPAQAQARDIMVKQAMKILLKDETAKYIVDKAQSAGPQAALVETAVPLLKMIHAAAERNRVQVEMVTVLAAGIEVLTVLAKLLEQAGVITENQIPQVVAEAAKVAVEQHNKAFQGGAPQLQQQPPQLQQSPQPQQPAMGMMGAPA